MRVFGAAADNGPELTVAAVAPGSAGHDVGVTDLQHRRSTATATATRRACRNLQCRRRRRCTDRGGCSRRVAAWGGAWRSTPSPPPPPTATVMTSPGSHGDDASDDTLVAAGGGPSLGVAAAESALAALQASPSST